MVLSQIGPSKRDSLALLLCSTMVKNNGQKCCMYFCSLRSSACSAIRHCSLAEEYDNKMHIGSMLELF